jgi:hypothetical protein
VSASSTASSWRLLGSAFFWICGFGGSDVLEKLGQALSVVHRLAETFKQGAKSLSEASGRPVETCEAKLSFALAAAELAKIDAKPIPLLEALCHPYRSLAKKLECHENRHRFLHPAAAARRGHPSPDGEVFQRHCSS